VKAPRIDRGELVLAYQGLDQVPRQTRIVIDPAPRLEAGRATIPIKLAPQEVFVCVVGILPLLDEEPEQMPDFETALDDLERTYRTWNDTSTLMTTDNEIFDDAIRWRNLEDLRVLSDDRPTGLLPTAGIPWYAVPFGRDALITSMQTLGLNPDIARGSLRYLAQEQGREIDEDREEEPGKIMHEIRFGELARLRKIPHTPYYGSVDATPLFLVLLVELLDWTGEVELLNELWPNVEAALEWIDRYGDRDGDGFVEYSRHSRFLGVRNQGWKDSRESLMWAKDEPAPLPAALVEVQGYVYRAKAGLARWCRQTGRQDLARRLEEQAQDLRRRFDDRFWMPDAGFYAQALDGQKRQVPSVTSNPGHCLWSGIVGRERAALLAQRLVAPDMFCGWGVRTLSSESPFYNPMSYHNGSVWPHDNSILAHGLRRYRFAAEAELVARSVLQACMRFADDRIPELFCGFERDHRFFSGPGEYLVSCSPQAWGAGALFHFVQTLFGIEADLLQGHLRIDPVRTPLFGSVEVQGMRIADGELDFSILYGEGAPQVTVQRKPGAIKTLQLGPG
ncbi:MAG: MGH1-like glycoside hydrolase domain-containing protein, partial [Candidatus Dormibacteraceae bacterium]